MATPERKFEPRPGNHYDDEDCVLASSIVTGSPTILLQSQHLFGTMEGSSICYYFRIGTRKVDTDKRHIRELEYNLVPCRCGRCVSDERRGIGLHASFASRNALSKAYNNTADIGLNRDSPLHASWKVSREARQKQAYDHRETPPGEHSGINAKKATCNAAGSATAMAMATELIAATEVVEETHA